MLIRSAIYTIFPTLKLVSTWNIWTLCDDAADRRRMVKFLNNLANIALRKTSAIFYISLSLRTLFIFSALMNVTILLAPDVLNSSLIFGSSLVDSGINDR